MPCGYVFSAKANAGALAIGVSLHILREASALSVLLQWALPEPLQAGRATGMALTLFLYKPVRCQ